MTTVITDLEMAFLMYYKASSLNLAPCLRRVEDLRVNGEPRWVLSIPFPPGRFIELLGDSEVVDGWVRRCLAILNGGVCVFEGKICG